MGGVMGKGTTGGAAQVKGSAAALTAVKVRRVGAELGVVAPKKARHTWKAQNQKARGKKENEVGPRQEKEREQNSRVTEYQGKYIKAIKTMMQARSQEKTLCFRPGKRN